jgi:hypothetical protein
MLSEIWGGLGIGIRKKLIPDPRKKQESFVQTKSHLSKGTIEPGLDPLVRVD